MSETSTTALDDELQPGPADDPPVIEATATPVPESEPPEPWTTDRVLRVVTPAAVLGLLTLITFFMLHPEQIFSNTTPTGGDMGAHVWAPAYLRDHLLPNFQLSGWSMDWYSGLPVYRFYMVVPALAIVLLDVVLPYGVAFKIVAVLGILTLPLCCWAFGRLARLPFPVPELLAIAGFIYLWDESYTIYGGNIASTMAGEFSFSIALSLAVLGFGLFIRGLQTGEYRARAAVVLALAVLCHGIVAIYVAVGLILMVLLWIDRTRWRYAWTTIATMSLLSAFWIVPFVLNHQYMTDMKYHGEPGSGSFTSYWDMFFHLPPIWNVFFTALAFTGLVVSVVRRNLVGVWIGVTGLVMVAFVYLFRDSLPGGFGLLWNPRLIPMINLCRYFLGAIAIWEIARAGLRYYQLHRFARTAVSGYPTAAPDVAVRARSIVVGASTVAVVLFVTLLCWGWRFQKLPGGSVLHPRDSSDKVLFQYAWGPFRGPARSDSTNRGFVDGWANWNFKGYEGKNYYGEYRNVVQTMAGLGEDPTHGCGRALWENYEGNNSYGTTMALMLLPFWTDGCIGSSEGLYFEASGTTPYHFLAAAAMSKKSSNPVRELRYTNNNAAIGVPYLQALGIKYYMAVTPEAVEQASKQPELEEVAVAGPWHVYQVAGSDIVVPLTVQPVVVNERSGDQRERWLEVGTSWLQNNDDWAALPADSGPSDWDRIDVAADAARVNQDEVDVVEPATPIEPVALDPVTVSNVEIGEQSVKFSVDQLGVPVLVRVSYFPNWNVSGAEGPYRVAPNMMVVIPTSTEVELTYGRSLTDYAAYLLTFFGLVALFFVWRRGDVRHANLAPHLTGIDPDDGGAVFTPAPPGGWAGPPPPLDDDPHDPDDPDGAPIGWRDEPLDGDDGPNSWAWEGRPHEAAPPVAPMLPRAAADPSAAGVGAEAGAPVPAPTDPDHEPAPDAGIAAADDQPEPDPAVTAAEATNDGTDHGAPADGAGDPTRPLVDEDVSAGLRIPDGIDMSRSVVDPATVDLAWIDRYTTGEHPVQPPDADGTEDTADGKEA